MFANCRTASIAVLAVVCTLAWSCAEPRKVEVEETPPAAGAPQQSATPQQQPAGDSPAAQIELEPRQAAEVATSTAEAPALEVPTEPEVAAPAPTQASAPAPAPLPASQAPLPLDNVETANLSMPAVVLTDQHAALCKLGVGDAFPELALPDLDGQQKSLADLRGDKLTLVVFWNARQTTGLEELSDLARYHLPRFGDKGLAVVAVNSGDQRQLASEMAQHSGANYPVLSDADGQALGQVATGKLPRTYLLDPAGKIVWFDLEYSPTTRRDLAAAIRVALGQ